MTETTSTASSATTRYTITDLCRDAEAHGFAATPRLITDWVELGLLDAPDRHGLGRARGSTPGTWPEAQRQLFLALLDKRREVKHIPPLCNLPVWLWLFWGDEYVPLRQVRRALATWGGIRDGRGVSWGQARTVARLQVDRWGSPDAAAKDRKTLVDALTTMIYNEKFDFDALMPLLERVFDPNQAGQGRGPMGAQMTVEDYVLLIRVRLEALMRLDSLDDSLFEWARFAYLTVLPQYLQDQPRLAADPEFGHLFTRPDLEQTVNDACLSLISTLGLAVTLPPSASDDTLGNPKTWLDHRLKTNISHTAVTNNGLDIALEVKPEDD